MDVRRGSALSVFRSLQVRRILSGSLDKSPFSAANARHVRIAGLAVICAAAAKALRDLAFARFITSNVKIPNVRVGYVSDLGLSTAFLGLMVLAVAEVMRTGSSCRKSRTLRPRR